MQSKLYACLHYIKICVYIFFVKYVTSRCSVVPIVTLLFDWFINVDMQYLPVLQKRTMPTFFPLATELTFKCLFFCTHVHACSPVQLLTYQTQVGWPVSCLVSVAVSPLLALSTRNICQGGGLEPYLWLCCLGHKGPRLGFSLRASWYIALVAWHQLTQHSCPGHPTKTSLTLWMKPPNNGDIFVDRQTAHGALIETKLTCLTDFVVNFKAITSFLSCCST